MQLAIKYERFVSVCSYRGFLFASNLQAEMDSTEVASKRYSQHREDPPRRHTLIYGNELAPKELKILSQSVFTLTKFEKWKYGTTLYFGDNMEQLTSFLTLRLTNTQVPSVGFPLISPMQ
jgi:hypothetical protein